MSKRRHDEGAERELAELLAVTGTEHGTLMLLIDLCDQIIAQREISSASPTAPAKIDTEPLSVT